MIGFCDDGIKESLMRVVWRFRLDDMFVSTDNFGLTANQISSVNYLVYY